MSTPAYGDHARHLRGALLDADFTVDGVADRLGAQAMAALDRHETVPAERALRAASEGSGQGQGPPGSAGSAPESAAVGSAPGGAGPAPEGGDTLAALVRLFLLQQTIERRDIPDPQLLDLLDELHLVELAADVGRPDDLRASRDLRPYGEAGGDEHWWVVSDLGTGLDGRHRPLTREHVLGVGGASTTLAQLTPRQVVGRTLDVGTGCGVQALHASRHSPTVVATDVSTRAIAMARLTAALSDVEVDLRQGNLLEPAGPTPYDLIVSNPPFVIGAPTRSLRHTYRDAGLPLDEVCARLVAEAPQLLSEGGTLVMLANWVHRDGQPWDEWVADWLPFHGVDALVAQREVLDPAAYVATWLRDAGEAGGEDSSYVAFYDSWLEALERERVDAIGLGFVVLQRTDADRRVTLLDWPHPVQVPLGPDMATWLQRQRWLGAHTDDDSLARATVVLAADVLQEQVGRPGEEHPEHVVLRQQVGLRRAHEVDTATAALAGACDGTLPVGALVAAVEQVVGQDASGTPVSRVDLLAQVRVLVESGVLTPSGLTAPGILSADQRGTPPHTDDRND